MSPDREVNDSALKNSCNNAKLTGWTFVMLSVTAPQFARDAGMIMDWVDKEQRHGMVSTQKLQPGTILCPEGHCRASNGILYRRTEDADSESILEDK